MFRPKIVDTLKNYSRVQFQHDIMSGVIVGIVALPLAIAFAIASGVSPEKGLITAVVAGFIISAMGGSRVQIGGPTGAFIIIVYGIVATHGVGGLIIATFMGGVMLVIMGVAKLGTVIRFIPHPLIVGFTSGIALIILSSQLKDFFGLQMGAIPADFISKWVAYFENLQTVSGNAILISILTIFIIIFWPRVTRRIPGSLVALVATTAIVQFAGLPVETIGTRFGTISSSIPAPVIPPLDFPTIRELIQPAFTIALLGGIESLLSAVVADGMIGGNHRSNTELIAQGTANIASSIFGGLPATGAIARTATNVKNGGRTPVAGIVHAFTLLLIMLFIGKWAALIPMATLAGILVIVAYNMSEWKHFLQVLKGSRSDAAVLLTTFFLTVIIDLTVAIEIGMVLAMFLFMRSMIRFSGANLLPKDVAEPEADPASIGNFSIPPDVEVFEIKGPLFFGAAYKFREAMRSISKPPKLLVIRMRQVPVIDASGIKVLRDVHKDAVGQGTKLILAEVQSQQVMTALRSSRLLFAIGKGNVKSDLPSALQRCSVLLKTTNEVDSPLP